MVWQGRSGKVLRGAVLAAAADPGLQLIAADAVAVTRADWSAITLHVNAVLVCRASHAMPSALRISSAWPRRGSFCELVVENQQPLQIQDANIDSRGSSDIRRRHGVVSYAGVPIQIGRVVTGTLCVHDSRPRRFDVELLERLASLASARLEALANEFRPSMQLLDLAIEPAFAQIRNKAMPLHTELATVQHLLDALDTSHDAREVGRGSLNDVHNALDGIKSTVRELLDQFGALQTLLQSSGRPRVNDIVRASASLSSHHTGLVGGVKWNVADPDRTILSPATTSVGLVSATLSLIAQGLHSQRRCSGIAASVAGSAESVTFALRASLEREFLDNYTSQLETLVEGEDVRVDRDRDSLVVTLPAA